MDVKQKVKSKELISRRLRSSVNYYFDHFCLTNHVAYKDFAKQYFDHVNKISEHRGPRNALLYCKEFRLTVTRYLTGEVYRGKVVSTTKEGLPKGYPILKTILSDLNVETIRSVLTVLTASRSVVLKSVVPDVKAIVDTWGGQIPENWEANQSPIFRSLRITKHKLKWNGYHISTKSGPNGQALNSCMEDLTSLEYDELRESIEFLGGEKLRTLMSELYSDVDGEPFCAWIGPKLFKWKGNLSLRRLSFIPDAEGKTRNIGILDYWSQTALKPIHEILMKILKRIPEDCTYNQGSFKTKLQSGTGMFFSFDLTNATERMPLEFQKHIISYIFGEETAEHWHKLLVSQKFSAPGMKPILFGSGQPMGAYSSWPAMALTHHVIVWLAGRTCKVSPRGKYVLLGDDIVIADEKLAASYLEILKTLDMPISMQKTHKSKDLYEFAKRWVWKGSEVTPFPIPALVSTWKRYYLLQNTFQTAEERGFVPRDGWSKCVLDLMHLFGKKGQAQRIVKLYEIFDVFSRKDLSDDDRNGRMTEVIRVNMKPSEALVSAFEKGEFTPLHMMRQCIKDISREHIRQTSLECIETQKDILGRVRSNQEIPQEKVLLCENLLCSHPIFKFSSDIFDRRSEFVERFNTIESLNESIDKFVEILERIPRISLSIFSQRAHHKHLAGVSKAVKRIMEITRRYGEPVNNTLEYWVNVHPNRRSTWS